ncbi:MAG: phage terminase large subunit family protein [Bacillota bacterium]
MAGVTMGIVVGNLARALRVDNRPILRWIGENEMVSEKGIRLELYNRAFLREIFEDESPEQVVPKCSQVGLTTLQIIKTAFFAKRYGYGVIYTLPTRDLVSEFHETKVLPMIEKNEALRPSGTDKVGAKRFGSGFVLYRGTFGERQSIMVSSDLNVYDEEDRSNLAVIEGLESRLQASQYAGQWHYSNPTVPNVGVDKVWQQSDQKHWFVRCPGCGKRQYLSWPDSVDIDAEQYVCVKCKRVLDDDTRRRGVWVPKWAGKSISGYWISQMMAPWKSAADVIWAFRNKTEDYFYNFVLGLPFAGGPTAVGRGDILKNLSAAANDGVSACMGVDQGKVHHCIIGNHKGLFRFVVAKTWEEVKGLITQYDVRCCVIDGNPDKDEATKLREAFPFRVYLNFYVDDPKRPKDLEPVDRGRDAEGVLLAERTQVIDRVIKDFKAGKILITPHDPVDPYQLEEYAKHWAALYEVRSTDKMGNEVRRWANSGPDHWAHASVYWWEAMRMHAGELLPAVPSKEE